MTSIVPSRRPSLIAATSASVRRGGLTRAFVPYPPTASSVMVGIVGACFGRHTDAVRLGAPDDLGRTPSWKHGRCADGRPSAPARRQSRATITSSAAAGMPLSPRCVARGRPRSSPHTSASSTSSQWETMEAENRFRILRRPSRP
ncbi:MAG: hypothetical protein MZU97_18780 [Bacillus subtilis]|nr:hypothetical protein [Bacillus subtilis]